MSEATIAEFEALQAGLYDVYAVRLEMKEPLCGGVPKNPDLIQAWIEAGTGHKDAKSAEMSDAAKAELLETTTEKSWNGFKGTEERGLFIEPRQVKAMFREAASMLRITTQKIGSKQVLQHGFFVFAPDGGTRIFLDRAKPDGFEESPIHVTTAQGPRSALKRVDYVLGVHVDFRVHVLKTTPQEKRHVGVNEIKRMLAFSMNNGLGADRSQGKGQFRVVEFEKVED